MRRAVIFFFLFCAIAVNAQQARQYSFKHFTVINGLASNTVSDVVQDKDGYMWMATINGLQRFDGNSFVTFRNRRSDPATIPTNHIVKLYKDRKENLWLIGDNNKAGIFDTKKFVFTEIPLQDKTETFYFLQHFTELPTGELLLINARGEIYRYDESKRQLLHAENILPVPPHWKCHGINWDISSKTYWLSCDSGLVQYNPATKHLNYRGHNPDNDPVIKSFEKIPNPTPVFTDANGNVIFVTWPPLKGCPYIHRYNRRLNKAEEFVLVSKFGYHEIDGFLKQKNGRLWVYGNPFFC